MVVKQLSKAAAEEEGASRVAGIMAGNGAGYPAPFSIYCISKFKTQYRVSNISKCYKM